MCKNFKITKNKSIEIEIGNFKCSDWSFFSLNISWTRKTDHYGFKFHLTIWNWLFNFIFYDNRHYNDIN